jgi:aryl-alcohol dehydrogenase-like predicted oxidoreductase
MEYRQLGRSGLSVSTLTLGTMTFGVDVRGAERRGLVRSGKVRYVGCSNYAGWQLLKELATSERHDYQRFISQQIHYTVQAREAEYELVPIALEEASTSSSGARSRAACSRASTGAGRRARRARAS